MKIGYTLLLWAAVMLYQIAGFLSGEYDYTTSIFLIVLAIGFSSVSDAIEEHKS